MRFAWNSAVSITSCIGKDKKKHNEGWRIIFRGREYRPMTHGWSMDVDRHIIVMSSAMPLTNMDGDLASHLHYGEL